MERVHAQPYTSVLYRVEPKAGGSGENENAVINEKRGWERSECHVASAAARASGASTTGNSWARDHGKLSKQTN